MLVGGVRSIVFLFLVALLGCSRSRNARAKVEVPAKVRPIVAALASVPEGQVTVQIERELFTHVWFARADAKVGAPFRCFVDWNATFCARDASILSSLVTHRRLGDNRGSLTDGQWTDLVRAATGLVQVFGEKGFELPPGTSDLARRKLEVPRVDRPIDAGAVLVDVYGTDEHATLVRVQATITGAGAAVRVEALR